MSGASEGSGEQEEKGEVTSEARDFLEAEECLRKASEKSAVNDEVNEYVNMILSGRSEQSPTARTSASHFKLPPPTDVDALLFDSAGSPHQSVVSPVLSDPMSPSFTSPTPRVASDGRLKLYVTLETDGVQKGLLIEGQLPFAAVHAKIMQKFKKEGLIYFYTDDEGGRIAVEDDESWDLFKESSVGKLKLLATTAAFLRSKEDLSFTQMKTLKGHTGAVYCCSISRDGKYSVTGGRDNSAKVWDNDAGICKFDYLQHKSYVLCCDISNAGGLCVTGSFDGVVNVWELQRGKTVATIKDHKDRVYDAKFSPDSTVIATASCDKLVRVFRVSDTHLLHVLDAHTDGVICVGFGQRPKSTMLCSGSDDTTLRLWDWRTGASRGLLTGGHGKTVWCCAFSSDDALMVSTALSPEALVWDMNTRSVLRRLLGHGNTPVHRVAFIGAKRFVTCGRDNFIVMWDVERQEGSEIVTRAAGHTGVVYCVQAAGNTIISSSGDKSALLWEVNIRQS